MNVSDPLDSRIPNDGDFSQEKPDRGHTYCLCEKITRFVREELNLRKRFQVAIR